MNRVKYKNEYLDVCKWLVYVSAMIWIVIIVSMRGAFLLYLHGLSKPSVGYLSFADYHVRHVRNRKMNLR